MGGLVESVADKVPCECHARRLRKEGCAVSLKGIEETRVVVDLDCDALDLAPEGKRCDYLVVGEESDAAWVAVVEHKGGAFKAGLVVEQLQGGADAADQWLPARSGFQFVPVLAHGKGVHKKDQRTLRSRKIKLRGQEKQTVLIGCGGGLKRVFKPGGSSDGRAVRT